jgi:hypothetical protein
VRPLPPSSFGGGSSSRPPLRRRAQATSTARPRRRLARHTDTRCGSACPGRSSRSCAARFSVFLTDGGGPSRASFSGLESGAFPGRRQPLFLGLRLVSCAADRPTQMQQRSGTSPGASNDANMGIVPPNPRAMISPWPPAAAPPRRMSRRGHPRPWDGNLGRRRACRVPRRCCFFKTSCGSFKTSCGSPLAFISLAG